MKKPFVLHGLHKNTALGQCPAHCAHLSSSVMSKHETLIQCCANVYEAGPTLSQHWTNVCSFGGVHLDWQHPYLSPILSCTSAHISPSHVVTWLSHVALGPTAARRLNPLHAEGSSGIVHSFEARHCWYNFQHQVRKNIPVHEKWIFHKIAPWINKICFIDFRFIYCVCVLNTFLYGPSSTGVESLYPR